MMMFRTNDHVCLSHALDASSAQKRPSEQQPIRKIVDKAKETTNKDNGLKNTAQIPMCEYISCRQTQGKPLVSDQ